MYAFLKQQDQVSAVISCHNSAYILQSTSQDELSQASKYYANLETVNCYSDIDDAAIKVALRMPPEIHDEVLAQVQETLGDVLTPVTSGHEWMDLILPGVDKGRGIQRLQDEWGIKDSEIAAFGDSQNDLEMLNKAKFSFAMDNAHHKVKSAARYRAPHNNQEGVLQIVDHIIANDFGSELFLQLAGKAGLKQ